MKKLALAFLVSVACIAPANATPTSGQCSGIVNISHGDITLTGKDEGVCVINKIRAAKVLQACSAGKKCTVKGMIDLCQGVGECVEIVSIKSANP